MSRIEAPFQGTYFKAESIVHWGRPQKVKVIVQWLRMRSLWHDHLDLNWDSTTCHDHLCYLYISLPLTAQAVIAKYHRLGGLNHRHLLLPVLEVGKPKIKVLAELFLGERPLPGAQMVIISLCTEVTSHCLHRGRARALLSFPGLIWVPIPLWGSTLMISSESNWGGFISGLLTSLIVCSFTPKGVGVGKNSSYSGLGGDEKLS